MSLSLRYSRKIALYLPADLISFKYAETDLKVSFCSGEAISERSLASWNDRSEIATVLPVAMERSPSSWIPVLSCVYHACEQQRG